MDPKERWEYCDIPACQQGKYDAKRADTLEAANTGGPVVVCQI